jgi:subtilisin family serine protease
MKKNIFPVFSIWIDRRFLLALFLVGFILAGQVLANPKLPTIGGLDKKDSKVSPLITSAITKMKSSGVTKENAASLHSSSLSNPLVKIDDAGDIQTYIYLQNTDKENISKLESMGVKIEIVNAKYDIVQAWIPFDKIEEVSNLSFVKKITPPSYGRPRTGSVNSEGDAVIQSNVVRSSLKFDGTGVTVGVISDGVDHMKDSLKTGDLPNNIIVGITDQIGGDEGTALLEIIHDIAPGARLAFSTGNTSVEFINSVVFLVNTARVDVIVDDLGFTDEPNFQDGPIAREAENAVNNGVVFVSAAGNDADKHYQALYVEAPPQAQSNGSHLMDFGAAIGKASTTLLPILVGANQQITMFLQWNDPFGGSSNDYDLFLLDSVGNQIPSCTTCMSTNTQNGSQDPIEVVMYQNNTPNIVVVNVAINRFRGVARTLAIFSGQGTLIPSNFDIPSDTVFGHPAAKGVIAVGAVPATNDQFCSTASGPSQIEDFSSQGPEAIFFPSFEQRLKPDVVAPDGIHISGAGGFGSADGKGGFILCGTSGSAPHVAGAVALMLQANPNLTPDQVASALENTAMHLGMPVPNDIVGFGLIDALADVQSVSGGGTQPPSNGGGNSNGKCALGGPVAASQGLTSILIFLIPLAMLSLKRLMNKIRQGERIR